MLNELDRRLDLDIDEILESPKLRLKLSPAELDRKLLDFYNRVSESPGGDVIRVIGGGQNVGMQNLYMKQQAQKQLRQNAAKIADLDLAFLPAFSDVDDDEVRTATQWVRRALRQHLPSPRTNNSSFLSKSATKSTTGTRAKNDDLTKMSLGLPAAPRVSYQPLTAIRTVRFGSTHMRPPRSTKATLLM